MMMMPSRKEGPRASPPAIVASNATTVTTSVSNGSRPQLTHSPQLLLAGDKDGDQLMMTHYSHLKHPLLEISSPELFTCGGCKEFGAGNRLSCQQCDFQLHRFCALCPPALKLHPFHPQHQLILHSKPYKQGGLIAWPRCEICGKSVKGFTFRCRACSFQMHPCCAMLTPELHFSGHPDHFLRLLAASGLGGRDNTGGDAHEYSQSLAVAQAPPPSNADFLCGECKNKRSSGRVYRCTVCNYHLHALCAKSMINGLKENGFQQVPAGTGRPGSVLGTAARLATQVVVEFLGGLIEGFGEGVGEVIVQNITRGRRNSRRSSNAQTRTD